MAKVFNFENYEFNLSNFPNYEERKINWSRSGDKSSSPMHSISSYLAMFSPAMPKYFIEKLTKKGDLIYDPFSGRGTTALKAREMQRNFIGSDLNPYAIVLSRSKIARSNIKELFFKINNLQKEFLEWIKIHENDYRKAKYRELRIYYSPKILKQLIFLRENYGKNWRRFNQVDNLLFGFIVGLMHGPMRKNGESIYFSLDMPNTISMSPGYVEKYSQIHNLLKPKKNIFELVKNRINHKFDNLFEKNFNSKVFEIDALEKNNAIPDKSVNLIITSPPYLSIVNYTNSNWLKLWILGYERKKLKNIKLSDNLKFNEYIDFILSFLKNVFLKIKDNGHIALIIGDVYGKNIIEEVWDNIKDMVNFKLVEIYWDESYLQTKKTTNLLNKRKGRATIVEKVLLLRK